MLWKSLFEQTFVCLFAPLSQPQPFPGSTQGSHSRPNLYMASSKHCEQDMQDLGSSFSKPCYILPASPVFFHHFKRFLKELG